MLIKPYMNNDLVRYADIKENDVIDGEGICVSFWTQGCPFQCKDCHNPNTWDYNGGIQEKYSVVRNKIIEALYANDIPRNFSILGGEPLCWDNKILVSQIIKSVRNSIYIDAERHTSKYFNGKIYLWTGFTWENMTELQRSIVSDVDVLIDGQYKDELRDITLFLRGSKNQRVIDVQKTIAENKIVLYHS